VRATSRHKSLASENESSLESHKRLTRPLVRALVLGYVIMKEMFIYLKKQGLQPVETYKNAKKNLKQPKPGKDIHLRRRVGDGKLDITLFNLTRPITFTYSVKLIAKQS
jgi:hypothetical protein